MNLLKLCDKVLAQAVFRIIESSFKFDSDSDHKCFRVKNLRKSEILVFLDEWSAVHEDRGLQDVQVIVAGDSDEEYPKEYRAVSGRSITWYRNHNENSLVYLETKRESDEQGLKNIFTLQDGHLLNGYFSDQIDVPKNIVELAWIGTGGTDADKPVLLFQRLLEVLNYLHPGKTKVPVRNFIKFAIACCSSRREDPDNLSPHQLNGLIGKQLFHLARLFPDEFWASGDNDTKIVRRFDLNFSYADLVTPNNADIEPESVEMICNTIQFRNPENQEYPTGEQEEWKRLCIEYSKYSHQKPELRKRVPFHIFEQLFSKDVKGLQLGDRVAQEIDSSRADRLDEFHGLQVQKGLNSKVQEDAQAFLDADIPPGEQPFTEVISKTTRRLIEKIAYPSPENFFNPLVKIAEISRDFCSTYSGKAELRLEMRLGKRIADDSPTIGLFAFIYGATLKKVVNASMLSSAMGITLSVDERLINAKPPPELQEQVDDGEGNEETTLEWTPIPIEFVLLSDADGRELDFSVNHEWLPDQYSYLTLLWFRFSAPDAPSFDQSIVINSDYNFQEWLSNVCNRVLALNEFCKLAEDDLLSAENLLSTLREQFDVFRADVSKSGLNRESINELIDCWNNILGQAKLAFVPQGSIDERLKFLLTREIINMPDSGKLLMLPSHPIRLRWIAAYLAESENLAIKALSGELKLNEQNDRYYLNWISNLSPHQQPPCAVTSGRTTLFASGERGWCEEFTSLDSRVGAKHNSTLDAPSIGELAAQIKNYMEAHPYKQDGLKLLLILQRGGSLVGELIRAIRKGEQKDIRITIHVLAPSSLWDEVITHFEKLPTENRIAEGNKLFPPLQLRLHELEPNVELNNILGDQRFDIALVPIFLSDQVGMPHNTEPDGVRQGEFDPLLDSPRYVYGGQQGGEISVSMIPRDSDVMLNNWSTLSVRHSRSSPVSKQQPQHTDFIELKINFQDTAKLYEELHGLSHWVVMLERYVTREQIENLGSRPDILTVRDKVGASGLYTLIVSSNSGKKFVVKRLQRKLTKVAGNSALPITKQQSLALSERIYEETRKVSPRLILQAMGISRATEEILGLMIAMKLAGIFYPASPKDGVVVWISLDEHPEWFNGASTTRADLCRLTLERVSGELYVDFLIVEGKFRKTFDRHGVEQVTASLELFQSIISKDQGNDEPKDARLWRERLLSAMENVNPEARTCLGAAEGETEGNKYRLPEAIRSNFRNGNYKVRSMEGLFSICCYTNDGDLTHSSESGGTVQVIRSYSRQVQDLVSGNVNADFTANPKTGATSNKMDGTQGIGTTTEEDPTGSDNQGIDISSTTSAHQGTDDSQHRGKLSKQDLVNRYQILLDKFGEFGIDVQQPDDRTLRFVEGPASILYRVKPGQGIDPKRLFDKSEVLKLALSLEQDQNIRFGNHLGFVTIDVPKNQEDRFFVDAEVMWKQWSRPPTGLEIPIGEDSYGNVVKLNFSSSNAAHLLIGGTTGSGKSEALNTILDGMITFYSPNELRLMLVDPKGVELQQYEDKEHLEGSIGWDDADAIELLDRAFREMQARYEKFKEQKGTRNLSVYNNKVDPEIRLPWWVVVLDEYGDLTSEKESRKKIEGYLIRLAQKARAVGIHVIIATQKPSAEVISTNLRSNLGAQLALRVKSSIESRVIIDEVGAETLNGKGDALLKSEGKLTRIQCAKT